MVGLKYAMCALSLAAASAQAAITINVPNGSFESPYAGAAGSDVWVDVHGKALNDPFGFGTGWDIGVQASGSFGGPVAHDGSQYLGMGNGLGFTNVAGDIANAGQADPSVGSYTFTAAFALRNFYDEATTAPNGTINLGIEDRTGATALVIVPLSRSSFTISFQDFSVTLPATTVAAGDTLRIFVDKLDGNGFFVVDDFRLVANQVPEPASLSLLTLAGLLLARRRRA